MLQMNLYRQFKEPFDYFEPHMHISLQSGDNEILKKMNRGYTREDYLEIIEKLRRIDYDFLFQLILLWVSPLKLKKRFLILLR